jgi:hypothetical protein
MEMHFKLMFLFPLTFITSCKRWDPNQQFSEEILQNKRDEQEEEINFQSHKFDEAKLGQSLADVIMIYGIDYKILASLASADSNWLRIEYANNRNHSSLPTRVELLFKNNQLIEIHKR